MIKILGFVTEVAFVCALLIFAYSQLVKPLVTRTPVFPMFRKRPKIERDIEMANEALGDEKLKRDLVRKQRKLGGNQGQQQSSTANSKS